MGHQTPPLTQKKTFEIFPASEEQAERNKRLVFQRKHVKKTVKCAFFRKKDEFHDASKQVRKALTSSDKGSNSSLVDEQNRLQQEASTTTASQVHQQLDKPEQEVGTAAAAGQVHSQPEQKPVTALAVSQVVH